MIIKIIRFAFVLKQLADRHKYYVCLTLSRLFFVTFERNKIKLYTDENSS